MEPDCGIRCEIDPPPDREVQFGGPPLRGLETIAGDVRGRRGVALTYALMAALELWIGYETSHSSFQFGLFRKRAEWLAEWTSEVSRTGKVTWGDFSCGLGPLLKESAATGSGRFGSDERLQTPLNTGCPLICKAPVLVRREGGRWQGLDWWIPMERRGGAQLLLLGG